MCVCVVCLWGGVCAGVRVRADVHAWVRLCWLGRPQAAELLCSELDALPACYSERRPERSTAEQNAVEDTETELCCKEREMDHLRRENQVGWRETHTPR